MGETDSELKAFCRGCEHESKRFNTALCKEDSLLASIENWGKGKWLQCRFYQLLADSDINCGPDSFVFHPKENPDIVIKLYHTATKEMIEGYQKLTLDMGRILSKEKLEIEGNEFSIRVNPIDEVISLSNGCVCAVSQYIPFQNEKTRLHSEYSPDQKDYIFYEKYLSSFMKPQGLPFVYHGNLAVDEENMVIHITDMINTMEKYEFL
ncbi:hypothetical protein K8R20_00080 [bacterium]|nr:hypothetical protein [bacterium]